MYKFLYQNPSLDGKIEYYIDERNTCGDELGIPVYKLEEAPNFRDYGIIVAARWEAFQEIRISLTRKGLMEFKDYVWCHVIGKKVMLLNANCHGPALLRYLRYSQDFCDKYFVYPLPMIQDNEKKEIGDTLLELCEVYVHQDIRSGNMFGYKFSDEYARSKLNPSCKDVTIPNFVEMGRWMFPQQGKNQTNIAGFPIFWEDIVLENGYRNGYRSISEYVELYNSDVYLENELQKEFDADIEKLRMREKNWDIKVTDFILCNYHTIPCYNDARHPSPYLMAYVGRKLTEILGCYDFIDDRIYVDINTTRDRSIGLTMPLLGCVKRHFSISYNEENRPRSYLIENYFPEEGQHYRKGCVLEEYIRGYLYVVHGMRLQS